ncbi:hypothetical protein M3795_25055 [Ralstonia pickettii]|uniref:hypothetical protein n=1 Tax=Ralstonia pickettii TaxID=329 RepID=UPI00203D10FB|nr:hypothetical protein [Ralstonia pickettii]MCM3583742.1 hypothetical protein [Ralstonia pickettii]
MTMLFLASAAVLAASLAHGRETIAGWIAFAILLLGACTGYLFECIGALPTLVLAGSSLLHERGRAYLRRNRT